MPYQFKRNQELEENFRRVAREQVGKGLKELKQASGNPHRAVHQVRKRCKKLRGLLRLVRPGFSDYARENRKIRDAARILAPPRDAGSRLETLELLTETIPVKEQKLIHPVRTELLLQQRQIYHDEGFEPRLESFQQELLALKERIDGWKLTKNKAKIVFKGYRKTYRRGHRDSRAAYRRPNTESFHEWRKRVKYHWYHLRLLKPVWPDLIEVQKDTADQLGSLLGDEHDLAVLAETIERDPERYGTRQGVKRLLKRIDKLRAELRGKSRPIGSLLYAEKPKPAARRIKSYWRVWEHPEKS